MCAIDGPCPCGRGLFFQSPTKKVAFRDFNNQSNRSDQSDRSDHLKLNAIFGKVVKPAVKPVLTYSVAYGIFCVW